MISREYRFHGYNSLRHVYQKGRTLKGAALSVKYTLNDRRDKYRVAVVVSRKVNKSAVVRNQIRRRLYEEIRSLTIAKPYDIVVTVYEEAMQQMEPDRLRPQLVELLKSAGIATRESTKSGSHAIIDGKEQ